MTKGSPTPPEIVEEVIAIEAKTNNMAETGRVLGMPRETVRDIVKRLSEPEITELRRLANNEYILKTWQNILDVETALAKKLATDKNIDKLALSELTRALKDLKTSVENVVQNINNGTVNNIQNNYFGVDTMEQAFPIWLTEALEDKIVEGERVREGCVKAINNNWDKIVRLKGE